jgi:hypothetical protein
VIRTEDGRLKLSASRLKAWMSCPMRWAATYLEGKRMEPTPSMAFGSALHRALEVHHRTRWLGEPTEDLLGVFVVALEGTGVELEGREREKLVGQAGGLLRCYLDRYGDEGVLAAELELRAPVVDPRTGEDLGELTGIIDLVTEDGRLVDLKTTARAPSALQGVLQNRLQLDCYRYLVQATSSLDVRAAEIRSLIRTKVPKVEVTQLPPRPFDGLFDAVRRYARAVEALEVYPRPGLLCSDSCVAIDACRAHHGLEEAAA